MAGRLEHEPPVVARRGRHRRQVRVDEAVRLPALDLGELPGEPRDRGEQRQADPGDGEHGAEQEPAADDHEIAEAVGHAGRQVQQRPAARAQVARQLEPAAGRADGGHPRPSTSTLPLPLIACTVNEASSVTTRSRTVTWPRSLLASTR